MPSHYLEIQSLAPAKQCGALKTTQTLLTSANGCVGRISPVSPTGRTGSFRTGTGFAARVVHMGEVHPVTRLDLVAALPGRLAGCECRFFGDGFASEIGRDSQGLFAYPPH